MAAWRHSGAGAVYWLRSSHRAYLRHATSVEKILEADEGRRLAYTVIGGSRSGTTGRS